MKNQHQFMHQMYITLYNCIHKSELLNILSKFNYDKVKLNEGMSGLQRLKQLVQVRDEAWEQARIATLKLSQAKSVLLSHYCIHLDTARLAYKREEEFKDHLKLCGRRKNATAEWLRQAERFYANVPKSMMEKYHVPKDELSQASQMVQQVMKLIALQASAKAKVQDLTQQRNQQYEAMKLWMQQFMQIAKVAMSSSPQQMESLGIIVPSA